MDTLPVWIRWLKYLSITRYATEVSLYSNKGQKKETLLSIDIYILAVGSECSIMHMRIWDAIYFINQHGDKVYQFMLELPFVNTVTVFKAVISVYIF